jgi:hypothetical protein
MVQFTEQQMRRLKRKAASEKVSVSELVRRSVERTFPETDEQSEEEKWRRASALVGKFRSNVHDLAARHDEYFAEAIEAAHRSRPPAAAQGNLGPCGKGHRK